VGAMIITTTSSLNEERNIVNFIKGYDFSDKILLADGGSTDNTLYIAKEFSKVEVIDTRHTGFNTKAGYQTSMSIQTNILIKRAKELGAEWIIKDDCDSWPNPVLKLAAKEVFNTTEESCIFCHHLYILGSDQYFPKMNIPGPGLWAWRPDRVDIYADESNPSGGHSLQGVPDTGKKLAFPNALLHYFAPDEETIRQKIIQKAARGIKQDHPTKWKYTPAEPLPDWAL